MIITHIGRDPGHSAYKAKKSGKKENAKIEMDFMSNEFFIALSRAGFIFDVKDDLMKRGKDDQGGNETTGMPRNLFRGL